MKVDLLSQAGKHLKEHKQYRHRLTVFLCLAVIVAFGTVTALKLYGQAMTHKMDVLECAYEVHSHVDECYEIGGDGNPGAEPVCGYADYVVHAHNDGCYDKNGSLVCALAEHELHEHEEGCYATEQILICGQDAADTTAPEETEMADSAAEPEVPAQSAAPSEPESPAEPTAADAANQQEVLVCEKEEHNHVDACYENAMTCSYEEHAHNEGCFNRELNCQTAEHAHAEECSDADGNLVCELEEHEHVIGCMDADGNIICGQEHEHIVGCYVDVCACTIEEHTHADECYEETLVCELEEHAHAEECRAQIPAETGPQGSAASEEPTEAEAEPTEAGAVPEASGSGELPEGHVHAEACYEEVKTLICGEWELHLHDDSCYAEECFQEDGSLIEGSRASCGLLQLEEHMHTQECFRTVELTPEEVAALNQGAKLHIHTDQCRDAAGGLMCGYDATHIHVPECIDAAGELVCGYGTAAHVHEDGCRDEEGNLVCGYETASHVHEEGCYDAEGNLQCGYEAAAHVHEENCYDEEGNLVCGYETACHVHEENCYDEEGNLICGYETASHAHEEGCYDEEGNLVCGYETASHAHEENCYDEEGNLVCGYETASHAHEENCYDEEGNLICGYETASHVHEEGCYDQEGNLICGYESADGHEHDIRCYDEEGNLICGYEDAETHEHDADCYDDADSLICGYEGARDHEHDAGCYDGSHRLICGFKGVRDHEHDAKCTDESGNLICGYEGAKTHEHGAECFDIFDEIVCGYEGVEIHAHTESCYDEEGNLTCGYEVPERYENSKVYQGENYVVVVKYNEDANVPDEAELIAEEITPGSDEALYGDREAEYRKAVKNEEATMRALLKIGFYLDGAEIEPSAPVAVSVQFLDEDGLAEGKPITVIHFGEAGTEKLDGSDAKDNSTTFKLGSFSEVAIGYSPEEEKPVGEKKLYISNDFACDIAPFHIVFHVEGEPKTMDGKPVVIDLSKEGETKDTAGATEAEEDSEESTEPEEDPEQVEPEEGSEESAEPEEETASEDNETQDDEAGDKTDSKLQFHVKSLDGDPEIQETLMDYIGESTELVTRNILHTISYQMTYGDLELDLSDCTITAEITLAVPSSEEVSSDDGTEVPKDPETDGTVPAADGQGKEDEQESTVTLKDVEVVEDIAENTEAVRTLTDVLTGEDTDTEVSVMAIGVSDTRQVNRLGKVTLDEENQDGRMSFPVDMGIMALAEESTANPTFRVQYYAYVQMMEDTQKPGTEAITIVDTVQEGQAGVYGKGILPDNGRKPGTREMYVQKAAVQPGSAVWPAYDPVYKDKDSTDALTKIYRADLYEFKEAAGGLEHINKFAKDGLNYDLFEVWVSEDMGKADSTDKGDWTVYGGDDINKLVFRNNDVTVEGEITVQITKNTIIRLVGRSNQEVNKSYPARFFDYDFTDGTTNRYLQGINNPLNYDKDNDNQVIKPRYGFGNNSSGSTGLKDDQLNGHNINIARESAKTIIEKCSFGLVQSALSEDGYPVIKANAPDLFNPQTENVVGRTEISGRSLIFNRDGDTYTLTSVAGSEQHAQNLDQFQKRDGKAYGTNDQIWTNQFWPMDNAPTFGDTANQHDPKFGTQAQADEYNLAVSDDKKEHNNFFGMTFDVEFELTDDYVGPLNYYFFGDDDMWVFLEYPDKTTQLICDIGGVHQAAGEYVDLWNYIQRPEDDDEVKNDAEEDRVNQKYKLKFFYTERGASGSTCWMQFTLPSVNAVPVIDYTGNVKSTLKLGKTVEGEETDELFDFTIEFSGDAANIGSNDYPYQIKDEDGNLVKSGDIRSGGTFQLGHKQTIEVFNLPDNTKYVIKEKENDNYEPELGSNNTSGTITKDQTVEGNIDWKKDDVVDYINQEVAYNLPETGGFGTTIYTIAGILSGVIGAGFLYKKKFRERRG